jgi:hypothetical protein
MSSPSPYLESPTEANIYQGAEQITGIVRAVITGFFYLGFVVTASTVLLPTFSAISDMLTNENGIKGLKDSLETNLTKSRDRVNNDIKYLQSSITDNLEKLPSAMVSVLLFALQLIFLFPILLLLKIPDALCNAKFISVKSTKVSLSTTLEKKISEFEMDIGISIADEKDGKIASVEDGSSLIDRKSVV